MCRGLDERWNALDEPRKATELVLEIDVSAANEAVDVRVLDPIRDGHDRRHRGWWDVVWDSYDCFFEDHPSARWDDAILSALSLAEISNTPRVILFCGPQSLSPSRASDQRMRFSSNWKPGVVSYSWQGRIIS